MPKPRVELQTKLEEILGSRNVYFQPPESFKLSYPCIVYELAGIRTTKADNIKYRKDKKYTVTAINKKPDWELPMEILDLEYCDFDRIFKADNLYHWVFSIYW